jgi:hypothetical protein
MEAAPFLICDRGQSFLICTFLVASTLLVSCLFSSARFWSLLPCILLVLSNPHLSGTLAEMHLADWTFADFDTLRRTFSDLALRENARSIARSENV